MGRFRLGSTSLLETHHVEKSTNQRWAFTLSPVSWFSEQRKSKTPGWSVRQCSGDVSLGNECKNKLQTHTQESLYDTEALKGHRVVWKIEIYYLIRMTYEWKSMSSGWHNNIVVTHPDEIPISAKSSGWHMVVWYVIRMTYCSVQKSSGWDTARS